MKRIALLLAAVVSGSGCVVSNTCDPQATDITWAFRDTAGTLNLACDDAYLSNPISYVVIYVDQVQWDSPLPCLAYGATYTDISSGTHEIIVEGYDALDVLITRDIRNVYVDSCGVTTAAMDPAEASLELLPDACSGGYLWYDLRDDTITAGAPFSAVKDTSLNPHRFPCSTVNGVHFNVPFGYYTLDWIEEVTPGGTFSYGYCSPTAFNVLTPGTHSIAFILASTPVCY